MEVLDTGRSGVATCDAGTTNATGGEEVRVLMCGASADMPLEDWVLNDRRLAGLRVRIDRQPVECEVIEHPDAYDIVVGNAVFSYNDIGAFTHLKAVQVLSAGLDRLPLAYMKEENITLYNARGVYSIPIAEYIVGRLLSLYKRFKKTESDMSKREWVKQRGLWELAGKTIAIYGYGSIGRELATRLKAFGATVIGVSRTARDRDMLDICCGPREFASFSQTVDVLVVTLPLSAETEHAIDYGMLRSLRKGAVLVNVSRGKVVSTADTIRALEDGTLSGAILDVFEEEPLPKDSPLWDMDNVLLSPHNSFEGENNQRRLEEVVRANITEELLTMVGDCDRVNS